MEETLGYVFDAIRLTKQELNKRVPLIGFAGAPWTLLCYMVEGKGSKTFDSVKSFCYTQPELAHRLLQMLTDTTIAYLRQQVKAGADIIQLFDSWGGLLSPDDFEIILPAVYAADHSGSEKGSAVDLICQRRLGIHTGNGCYGLFRPGTGLVYPS